MKWWVEEKMNGEKVKGTLFYRVLFWKVMEECNGTEKDTRV